MICDFSDDELNTIANVIKQYEASSAIELSKLEKLYVKVVSLIASTIMDGAKLYDKSYWIDDFSAEMLRRKISEKYQNKTADDITLYDIVEMLCAALEKSSESHIEIDVKSLPVKFELPEQIIKLIDRTLRDIDFWFYQTDGRG